MQKGKWLSKEDLQIAKKRREAKGKGERETYTDLYTELQEYQGEIKKKKKPSSVINAKK